MTDGYADFTDPDVEAPPRTHGRARLALLAAVAAGGVVGALARWGLLSALPTHTGQFPWGTFVVNVSGSLVLGFLLVVLAERLPRSHLARPILATGMLGAYTTFSTLAMEAVLLVRDHHTLTALGYVVASVAAGLVAVLAGLVIGRATLGPPGRVWRPAGSQQPAGSQRPAGSQGSAGA